MFTPYLLEPKYPVSDLVVITTSVTDYKADPTGKEDASPAIQAAIDDVAAVGGGVIYLPEGHYALRTPLVVRTAVTLRGEWISPEDGHASDKGTILECYVGKNDPDGTPQVTLKACSGIQCVTFYYPEQTFEAPVPYSPTVRQDGVDSATIENVTMINPWRGMQCGPDANELHYLHNVYMTPMFQGLFMDRTTDIGRMFHLIIEPSFYASFVPGTDLEKLRHYMLRNVTGVFMARSDWEYGYDIRVSYCHIGFLITTLTDSPPNSQLSSLHMYNCDIGFQLINVNPYGVALSDSSIVSDRPGLTAAIVSESSFRTVMQICSTRFEGPYPYLVCHQGEGELAFAHCSFAGWSKAAMVQKSGGLSVVGCSFEEAGKDRPHLILEKTIGGAQLLGNAFRGGAVLKYDEEAESSILFSNEAPALSVPPVGGHKDYPGSVYPKSHALFVATDFGAKTDGQTDCTASIQKALDAAGQKGGIVYLPAGLYRVEGQLSIPADVQLRGVFQVPCHTLGGGSVLMTYANRDNENGEPFIQAAEHAGLFGVVIYHPEQDAAHPHAYPWAFQARGFDCYAVNTVFVNPWLGADFATYPSNGHYISYISGAPIRCGIYCGNNSGEGWVENIQYNPHYFFRTNLPNKPVKWTEFWHNQIQYLEALKFGYNENEHLMGTFVFAANHGLMFTLQDGKGTTGKFIGHGTDGGQNGLYFEGCDRVDLINTELVTIEAPKNRMYFEAAEGAKGKMVLYNTLMWGAPHRAVVVNGGDVEFQLLNVVDPGKTALTVTGGQAVFSQTYFYRNGGHLSLHGGTCHMIASMSPRRVRKNQDGTSEILPHDTELDTFQSGGTLTESFTFTK